MEKDTKFKKKVIAEEMLLEKLRYLDSALKDKGMSKAEKEDLRIERMQTLNDLELVRA